jgi:DNA processing protein
MSVAGIDGAERQAWVALASVPGVGDLTFERLLAAYGSAAAALRTVARLPSARADRHIAAATQGRLRRGLAAGIRDAAADPGRSERQMANLGGWLLTPLDEDYPARLYDLEQPPPVVFGIGRVSSLRDSRLVAVVGTRRPTAFGRDLSARIGARLSQAGATVISGLAIGIDGAAHAAAIEAGGETIAVAGSGLDVPGPVAHRRLARAIAQHGALISELAPGVRATQGTFPRRNRIISALATATIVVEAPARSGALITARHALEQGRQLLVAPGRPMDRRVAGNLSLLRESPAIPLVGLDEMLVDLGLDNVEEGRRDDKSIPGSLSAQAALALLGAPERAVAQALCGGPQTVDGLCRSSGLPAGVVAAALTLLQLRGWARVLGTMQLPAGPLLDAGAGRVA